ncbi:class I SAM-dependent methyltransferase [Methylocaldum sp.]|uniref:class I SAM-dependent methyltransferase n=1 Tax=Methylocaldum sp. TaxID=1969727 RepID=UPI002D302848|nr:class I SAM-dependent methyltransferase [Methylocaldum sp.]HYE35269.1 class I SAM-dependent methyltransferase [Methylocaldum sp.]
MNRTAYNAISAQWDAARVSFFGREREYIDTFLADLPPSSSILDAGCGTGRPMAEYVIAHGHQVTGVDQSEELLAIARQRYPQARWIHSSLEQYEFDGCQQGVICWDSLFHIERSHHKPILSRISHSLPSGGRIMLTVGGSDHPAFTDSMFEQQFFYDSYPPQKVLEILGNLGFIILISEFMNKPTSGRDKGRYAIVAKKA